MLWHRNPEPVLTSNSAVQQRRNICSALSPNLRLAASWQSWTESPEAHQQRTPSRFWVWNEPRCGPGTLSHTTQLIYKLSNLPREDSDLTAMCFRSCTCKDNLYVFYFPPPLQKFGQQLKRTEKWLGYAQSGQLEKKRVSRKWVFWPFCTMYSHFKGKHTEIA